MLELKRYILTELKAERISKLDAARAIKQLNSEDSLTGMSLLQRRVSMGSDAAYLSEFSGEEHFLSDHKVLGNKILPGVAYIEMAASSAKDYLSRKGINPKSISLTNVVFSQPFVVNAAKAIAIVLSSVNGENDIHFSVSSHSDSGLCIHAEGTIKHDNQVTEETLNLAALHSKNKTLIDLDKFYSVFDGMGIEYGAAHKPVSEISIGSDGVFDESVIASLALPYDLALSDQHGFYLHPSILDGALQTSIALDIERFTVESHPTVPFRVNRIDIYSGVPSGKSLVVANKNALFDNNVNDVFDFFVCHPDGKVYLKMSGFYARPYGKPFREIGSQQAHVVDAGVTSKNTSVVNGSSLQKLVGELTLVPSWDVINIESTAVKASSDIPHTAIVIGGVPEQIEVLKTQFSRLVHIDSTTLKTVEEITEVLSSSDKVSHVVWFVPDSECSGSFSSVIEMQDEGVIFGLKLVKSLLALHYDAESLSLLVVTQRSLATYSTDLVNPTHGGVHGFVGALAKEYEHWRVRQIDLSSDLCSPLRDIHEIPEGITEYAHRHDQWFKKSLLLTSLGSSSASEYVKGGVYILFGGAGGLGVLLSEYLVKNYDAKIIWVGRRKENDEIEKLCNQVETFGRRPTYFSVDTMSANEVNGFRETIYKRYSRVNGIVFTALVLNDGALLTMDEEKFKSSLAAKVDLSVNVVSAFDTDSLDFMLFFSSLQSEFRAVGQSNYAAGSTFIDSFSAAVRQKVKYPVKVVSWGYWGSTGIVASDFYRTRMASLGINEIHPEKGMKLVEDLLSSTANHVGYIETDKPEIALSIGVSLADHVYGLKKEEADSFVFSENTTLPMSEVEYSNNIRKLNSLLDELLLFQLLKANAICVDGDVISVVTIEGYLHLWLQQSLRNLVGAGLVSELSDQYQISTETIRQISDVWDRWSTFTKGVNNTSSVYAGFSDKLQLVELTLKTLPSILSGNVPATTVMFPGGDLSLIEGLYKNNLISDFFNSIVAEQLLSSVKKKFDRDNQPVRILEVGAGSGGTSEKIFDALESISEAVCQYTFTDVSKVFLNHAEASYGENVDYLETKLFDVSVPAQEQSLPLGHYDFIVATNVLHACGDIRSALRNCKSLLKSRGLVFINEAICSDSYLHCTFGLLEGWWLFKDGEIRIPGSPIVSSERWKHILVQEGFNNINTPCENSTMFQQQVIIAASDGVVRQRFTSPIESVGDVFSEFDSAYPARPEEVKVRDLLPQDKNIFKQRLSDSIASVISDVVAIDKDDIHYDLPLSQVGVDSILVVKITNALRKTFSGIDSTLLFDCNSVESLSNYFIENNFSSVQGLFGIEEQHNIVATPRQSSDSIALQVSSTESEAKLPVPAPAMKAFLVDLIRKVMSEILRIDYDDVGSRQAFEDLGIDSILTVQISNAIKQKIGSFESTLLFDHRNIESLAAFLINDTSVCEKLSHLSSASVTPKHHKKETLNGAGNKSHLGNDSTSHRKQTGGEGLVSEIAIVGLSGRYAKSNNLEEFWENLKRGKNCIEEVPEFRWDWSEHLYPGRDGSGKIYTKWGGFIEGADHFDPLFFSISPREAENMDPQERLFLQCAYSTIEDAGYTPERLSESKTGVFAGVMNNTYQRQPSHWSVANRVSYCLNFDGPSFSIDTACSSSLTAIHLACNSLKLGECKQAIAGGVNIIESPAHYEGLTEMNMLSESNECRSFGDAADGFVDGEGVGAVLLKPLNEAIKDGDHIYGVIRGSAINHGGRTNGYSVPSPSAQATVISAALDSAGVDPSDVSYIEAHGTGTELGDPIEFSGLSRALGKNTKKKQFCALGSVKSNIGHCESAAGIAGLTKVLLQIKHKQLAPSLHSTVGNKNIDFDNSPFSLQKALSDWRPVCDENKRISRIAGMSSFGAGGANAHLIVEEYNIPRDSTPGNGNFIFVLSAKTKLALHRRVSEFVSYLDKAPETPEKIAYTLQVGREHLAHRLALVASSISDLSLKLIKLQSEGKSAGVFSSVLGGRKESVANGMDLDDQSYIVERCISNEQYEKLAKLWCQGFEISWPDLYPAIPCKVSLPTYPFEKESYWEPKKSTAVDKISVNTNVTPDAEKISAKFESTSGNLHELVQLSEVLTQSIIRADSLDEYSVEQMLIFGSPSDADKVVESDLSDICGSIKAIDVSSGFSISDGVMNAGLDQSKPLVCIHLYALSRENGESNYVAMKNHVRLVECMKAVKACGFRDVQHKFCGISRTEIERSYLESWFPLDKSLQMIAPGHRVSVIIEADTSEESSETSTEIGTGVDYAAWSQRLTEELAFGSGRNVVYLDGVPHVYTLKESPVGDAELPTISIIKEHGTYLITGGLGGLAMVFARYLAEKYSANLVLCGRSGLDESRKRKIKELIDLGAIVDYFSVSVFNESEMRAGVERACQKFGVIDGVFHVAGIENELNVFEKSIDDFNEVYSTKVSGALILDEILADQPLDFMAYFSSVSAVMGDLGAVDYAASNRFLLSYAEHREQRRSRGEVQGKSVAFAWPLMLDGGMESADSEKVKLYLQSSGQAPIDAVAAINLFENALHQNVSKVIVFYGVSDRIRRFIGINTSPKESQQEREEDTAATEEKRLEVSSGVPSNRSSISRPELKGFSLSESVMWDLKDIASGLLKIDRSRLGGNENLTDFGFDSISLAMFAKSLSAHFDVDVTPSVFFSYSTLGGLRDYFEDKYENLLKTLYHSAASTCESIVSESVSPATSTPIITSRIHNETLSQSGDDDSPASINNEAIAVIGMSGRFPGARDIEELWSILSEGRSAVEEIPAERFDWRDYFGDPIKEPGKTNGKWLGAIPGVAEFDPKFFEISPAEAEQMDPRQRLLLQESWRALEDAGLGKAHLSQQTVGMYVGVEQGDYQDLMDESPLTANHDGILAARLAYMLDLNGPALAINTACSSGLVAAHEACLSLRSNECDAAIAAGVNILLRPDAFVAMGKAGMLSSDGKCHAFSEDANGMVPGEAVVAVVLKRLSDAERDGDPIYGVIRGSGINYDGKTNGITAPSGKAQANLLTDVYKKHEIDPSNIEYIVTHGTGTRLGDPVEINALYEAFVSLGVSKKKYCALTSAKSNLGHTFAASGLVNLVSLLLSIRHKSIPASLHCDVESNYIPWNDSPFYVSKQNKEWHNESGSEMGAISSFGMSGTNAHMVVESYKGPSSPERLSVAAGPKPCYLLVISAKDRKSLEQQAQNLIQFVSTGSVQLEHISFTLLEGRHHFSHRAAVVVQGREDAIAALKNISSNEKIPNIHIGEMDRQFMPQDGLLRYGKEQLALVSSGADSSLFRESMNALAELYCQGYQFPWEIMFSREKVKRINLPTYPFLRRSYWVENASVKSVVTRRNTKYEHCVHPLLHRNISTLREQRFLSVFDGSEYFLSDHVVLDEKVLPGVAHLEMALAAAYEALGTTREVHIENVTFQKPLVVGSSPIEVNISLIPENDHRIKFDISSTAPDDTTVLHSTGKICLGSKVSKVGGYNLSDLLQTCQETILSERCYEAFSTLGLCYGASFRGIERISVCESSGEYVLVSSLVPEGDSPERKQFTLSPGLMDSALQSCIGFSLSGGAGCPERAAIPFAIEKISVYGSATKSDGVYAISHSRSNSSESVKKYNVDIVDKDGSVLVAIEGFCSRDIPTESSEHSQKNMDTRPSVLSPKWELSPIGGLAARDQEYDHTVIFCGELFEDGLAELKPILESADIASIYSTGENQADTYTETSLRLLSKLKALSLVQAHPHFIQLVISTDNEDFYQGLSAMMKSYSLEHSKVFSQVLQLDSFSDKHEVKKSLIREIDAGLNTPDVRILNGERQALSYVEVNSSPTDEKLWRDDGVYLVTGGMGGLGQLFVKDILSEASNSAIVLIGRRDKDQNIERTISLLKDTENNNTIYYYAIDVRNEADLKRGIQSICDTVGEITCVIHAAGISVDNLVKNKTESELLEVFASKVQGVVALDSATENMPLDAFVIFSSLSAVYGNVGQADYAAANAFMDAFASSRQEKTQLGSRSGKTISFNWPLWSDGGMQVDSATLEYLERSSGMTPLSASAGLDIFRRAMSVESSQIIVHSYIEEEDIKTSADQMGQDENRMINEEHRPPTEHLSETELIGKVQLSLVQYISDQLKVDVSEIDVRAEFSEFGFDSVSLTVFSNTLNEAYHVELSPTVFFEFPTVDALSEYLVDEFSAEMADLFPSKRKAVTRVKNTASSKQPSTATATTRGGFRLPDQKTNIEKTHVEVEPIAIVGAAGNFPDSPDLDQFWSNLSEGRDCISEIPDTRWDWASLYGDPDKETNKTNVKHAGVIAGVENFDSLFFGISPREAEAMDPQQRLLMTYAWKAIEDSGHAPESLSGSNTGLFIATGSSGYSTLLSKAGCEIEGFSAAGMASSVGPNRMSYLLNLHGPSEPIETACSSSLVAVHRAVRSIRAGDCDQAIVGGVNLLVSPDPHISFDKAGMLAKDGRCKTFSKNANGYVRGEGVGMMVLKPLSKAKEDGDNIYALIRGTAENHGGRSNSLTAPNPRSQADVIKSALRQSDIDLRSISYIEAHGTGTSLGDPIEVQGLKKAFSELAEEKGADLPEGYCALGSVKTNIGHLELAAGMASLMKVLLQMKHKTLVASLHCDDINPYIDLKGSPFEVISQKRQWDALHDDNGGVLPRRAGVSSFGFGGVNAHVIMEEYVPKSADREPSAGPVMIVLSAKTDDRLNAQKSQLEKYLELNESLVLADLAYTLQVGRDAMDVRWACVVNTIQELRHALSISTEVQLESPNIFVGEVKQNKFLSSLFASDEDFSVAISSWLSKGKHDTLCELWVSGVSLDWSVLYNNPRRIPLPSYPFLESRCWFNPDVKSKINYENVVSDFSGSSKNKQHVVLPPESPELLLYSEVSVQKNIPNELQAETLKDQLIVVVSDMRVTSILEEVYSSVFSKTYYITVEDILSNDSVLEACGFDETLPLTAVYFCPVEDSVFIEDIFPLWTLVRSLKNVACKDVYLQFCGVSKDAIEQAHLESWISLNRSLQNVFPEIVSNTLIEDGYIDSSAGAVDIRGWARRTVRERIYGHKLSAVYRRGDRYVFDLQLQSGVESLKEIERAPLSTIKPGGTYLITGGLGGVSAILAEYLLSQYSARLVLCGRTEFDGEIKRKIRSMESLGGEVSYFSASITDEVAMKSGLDSACKRFGVIDGVFHAAGVCPGTSIFDQEFSQFSAVTSPKIQGALILDRLLVDQPLDFVCYVSSISAILGDLGSCEYALANRFLLSYAALREIKRDRGEVQGRSLAIAWPMWANGGMQSTDSQQTEMYLNSSGQVALNNEDGLKAFELLLRSGLAKTLVIKGNPSRVNQFLGLTTKKETLSRIAVKNKSVVLTDGSSTYRPELKGFTLAESIMWDLKNIASQLLKIDRISLSDHENLADFGFDSISLAMFSRSLTAHFNVDVTPSVFFSYSTLGDLCAYFEEKYSDVLKPFYLKPIGTQVLAESDADVITRSVSPQVDTSKTRSEHPNTLATNEAVAVIGMSGRFPGARNIDELWDILREGRSAVEEIPAERFDWRDYFGDPVKEPGTTNGKWLGAIPGVGEFDPKFFEISPAEAEKMDPRQRLLLQEAWRALEDAGYGKTQITKQSVGMFVGVEQGDYQSLVDDSPLTANHDGILAARLAYMLDLNGPALAINTACSSGLVAAHEACLSLRAGDCNTAIAAGVNVLLRPEGFVAMGQAGMLSPDGKCSAFSKNANGMVPGEAVVAIVLKRLSDAERDGDPIYGVIRGSGINYDGKTNGITAPSGKAQSALLNDVYKKSAISPANIEYVVTHGTGTRLGDPVEINALYDVYKPTQQSNIPHCALTSTKSNLGHTFAASGLVSLVSLLLSMRHETIPSSLHCDVESDYIPWADSPFYVNKQSKAWPKKDQPRLGALSAFGMSGTNAHMVVESYDEPVGEDTLSSTHQYYILPLSAKDKVALKTRVKELCVFLQDQNKSDINLLALSYTLFLGRHHFNHRAAVVVQDLDDAIHALGLLSNGERTPNVFSGEVDRDFVAQTGLMNFGEEQLFALSDRNEILNEQESVYTLSDLYCQGYELSWEKMFGVAPPIRKNLPTYPFSSDNYWVNSAVNLGTLLNSGNDNVSKIGAVIHQNTSTLSAQRYSSRFTGNEFFLRDHVVQGYKVLPGVTYFEMAISAALDAFDGVDESSLFKIENVVLLSPLSMLDDVVDVHISLQPEKESSAVFEISSEDNGNKKIHAQGRIRCILNGDNDIDGGDDSVVEVDRLKENVKYIVGAEECYARYKRMGLEYGPSFRAVNEIYVIDGLDRERKLVADINFPDCLGGKSDEFKFHPSILDAALQASIGFVFLEDTSENDSDTISDTTVPFAFDSVELLRSITATSNISAVIRSISKNEDPIQKMDVDLLDSAGNVCIRISGFSVRKVQIGSTELESHIDNKYRHEEPFLESQDVTHHDVEPGLEESVSNDIESELSHKIVTALLAHISEQLKVKPVDIDVRGEFNEFGFDSVSLTVFSNTLNESYGLDVSPTVFFEYPTVRQLVDFLVKDQRELMLKHFPSSKNVPKPNASIGLKHTAHRDSRGTKGKIGKSRFSKTSASFEKLPTTNIDESPIAIVGVSGSFPESPDLSSFWDNLNEGRDCISEVPGARWDWDLLYGDPAREDNKTNIKHAGVIAGIDEFDPMFFGISPREAEAMDPQQRVLMTYVWKVIEDAGHAPESLSGSNTGVFIGTANSGYGTLMSSFGIPIEGYSAAGMVGSVGPNRMSYLLNLHGPSEPIETACSSSLVAVHRAVRAIRSGDCDQAIVGGVNLLVSPEPHISFSKAGMLSDDGRCKTFSEQANGYVRGEGVGMLMLKPLSQAEADNDHVYGLIRGSAENHGGKSNSLTAPNPRAQADLIKTALRESGVDPSTISYVEAHGTGTPLGDPIEVQGLKSAFSELAEERGIELSKGYCGLGSVKTNIGHLELAAGVAGMVKVLLQMKHKTLVPSLHCDEVNSYIDLENSPFQIVTKERAWESIKDEFGADLPRRAGVSSFGFGGVNAHVVLEEYIPSPKTNSDQEGPFLIVLSAKKRDRLQPQISQLSDYLKGDDLPKLSDLAYTLQVGRDAMDARWACVVNSMTELKDTLKHALLGGEQAFNVFEGDIKQGKGSLALTTSDEDFFLTINAWVEKRKLEKIADVWVQGLPLEWARLYSALPHRVSLPSYVFSTGKFWIKEDKNKVPKKVNRMVRRDEESRDNNIPHNKFSKSSRVSDLLDGLSKKTISVEDAIKEVVN